MSVHSYQIAVTILWVILIFDCTGNDDSLTIKDGYYPICVECIRKKKTPKARPCGKSVNT